MNLALVRRRAAHHARKERAKLISEVRRARALDQMKQAAAKVLLEGEPDRAIFKGGTMKLTMWTQLLATVPKTSPEDDELLAGDSETEPPPAR